MKTRHISLIFIAVYLIINTIMVWICFFVKGDYPKEFVIAVLVPLVTDVIGVLLLGLKDKGKKNDINNSDNVNNMSINNNCN